MLGARMGVHVLAGFALFGWIHAGLLLVGAALASAIRPSASASDHAVDTLLAAAALGMGIVAALGSAGVLGLGPVLAATTTACALVLAWRRQAPFAMIAHCTRSALSALSRSPVLAAIALVALVCVVRGLSLPQLSWDGLTYHTTYPATWWKEGRFVYLEGGGTWELYEGFPKGIESLIYLTLASFGRDHLLNVVNLPFWVAAAIAFRSVLGTLGTRGIVRDAWVLCAMACPVFLAYVTPAYVEVPTAACFTAALAASARAVVGREPRALMSVGLALGVALSIKLTMLSWVPVACVVILGCVRQTGWKETWRPALVGGAIAALICMPWYLRNLWVCHNPIYPSGLPGFHDGPQAGSLQNHSVLIGSSVVSRAAIGQVLDALIQSPWTVRYPLGPGWLYLGSMLGSLALPLVTRDPNRRLASGLFTLLAVFLLGVYAVTPYNGIYAEADTRFLGPSLLAAIGSCAIALDAGTARARTIGIGLAMTAVVLALVRSQLVRTPWTSPALLLATFLAMAVAAGALAIRSSTRARLCGSAAVLSLAIAILLLPAAVFARESRRTASYATTYDLHPMPTFPHLWARIDRLPPSRIAVTFGGVLSQEGWFVYPFFGADLRHHARVVNVETDDRPACIRRGKLRDRPNEGAWLQRIREYDYVAVIGEPVEHRWIRAHPELFPLVAKEGDGLLYRVRPAR